MRKSSASTAVPDAAMASFITAICKRSLATQAPPWTFTTDANPATPHGRYSRAISGASPALPYSISSATTSYFSERLLFVVIMNDSFAITYPPLEGEGRLASQDARRGGVISQLGHRSKRET